MNNFIHHLPTGKLHLRKETSEETEEKAEAARLKALEKEEKARFIGGYIYKGNDFDAENKRLKTVFENIAASVTKKCRMKQKNL